MSTPASKSTPKLPGKLGKYTPTGLLGRGGYGDVYVAEQKTGPKVAVKLLDAARARDDDAVARFKREAETARDLAHPNVVRVLDVGSSRNRHYIVMELVRGGSLEALLRREPDLARATRVLAALTEAARALAYAHARGVIHRDVKPANILLTRAGKAKVADFGLARVIDHSSLTTEGRLLGTASYMSPEQARGDRATGASDVYAMGVVIYRAIAGELPFQSDTQIGYLYQHAEVDPPRPARHDPYPPALADLALACLAKRPEARPTMAQVADRLAAISLRRTRRWRRAVLAAAIAVVALAVLAIAMPWILDPLCGDWFGGGVVRAARDAARTVHDAVW